VAGFYFLSLLTRPKIVVQELPESTGPPGQFSQAG